MSHSIVNLQEARDYFEAECLSPEEILRRLDLGAAAFVKLNVEGAEYEVVGAMFDRGIRPDDVCTTFDELHSPLDGKAEGRLRGLVCRFQGESYAPVHAAGCKVTFVRRHCYPGGGGQASSLAQSPVGSGEICCFSLL